MKDTNFESKAYGINFSKVNEGFLYDTTEYIVHAKTLNKAKSELCKKIQYENITSRYTNDEFTYINLPVIRYPEYDLQEYKGKLLNQFQIERLQEEEERMERLREIETDFNVEFCYIMKRGSYYADNSCGYVSSNINAGVYSKTEALSEARSCDEITIKPINIPEHNSLIQEQITKLQARLL